MLDGRKGMYNVFIPGEVKLIGGLFRERMELNRRYLLELDTDALLQNYYLEAGIGLPGVQVVDDPAKTNIHWGWEAPICQLRGHFLGHWMSAASKLIAIDGDMALLAKLEKVLDGLEECQRRNGGEWLAPIPEKYFDLMLKNIYIWSPQYVMHKVLMGLVDTFMNFMCDKRLDENYGERALRLADNLGAWFLQWTDRALEENPDAIYGGEQAGMLEIWVRLLQFSGNTDRYMKLIDRYKDNGILSRLDTEEDVLSDDHANASIPLSHGAIAMAELPFSDDWLNRAENFWEQAVTKRGMYATTGANAGEFWIPPGELAMHLGDRNQEFCTVYNMVRTSKELFSWNGMMKYHDYIERALYNGFLAQQNKETGMPTYFLPLTTGAKKKWGTKRHDFWCCHGTMIQAQTMYPELIYASDFQGELVVTQYIPSVLTTKVGQVCGNVHMDKKLTVTQSLGMSGYNSQVFFDEHGGKESSRWNICFEIRAEVPAEFSLILRRPVWAKGNVQVSVNDKEIRPEIMEDRIVLRGSWSDHRVRVSFEDGLIEEPLPDQPELRAFLDGPIVLAGLTDHVDHLEKGDRTTDKLLRRRMEHTYETFTWSQNIYETTGQRENIRFVPLYDVTDEAYNVYFEME